MKIAIEHKSSPLNEAVDTNRNQRHATFVPSEFLRDRLNPQAYRPEILEALSVLKQRFRLTKLTDCCSGTIRQGTTPEYGDGTTPCIKVRDIEPVLANRKPEARVTTAFEIENRESRIGPDTILINRSGEGSVGRASVYLNQDPAFVSDHVFACPIRTEVDSGFIAAFLNTWWGKRTIEIGIVGSTGQLALSQSHVRDLPVPDVETSIARAIGNKVRKAERLQKLAENDIHNLENTLVSILGIPDETWVSTKAFWTENEFLSANRLNASEYHPHTLQAEYKMAHSFNGRRLAEVMISRSDLSGGATPSGAEYPDTGIAFLRVQNVQPNRLDLSDAVYIDDETNHELRRSIVREHDILLTITGYPGSACCVQKRDLPLNINQHCVRFHVSEEWNPFYVAAFINCPWGKLQVTRRSIGGTRDALDYPSVLSLLIPEIPREQQDQIGNLAKSYADALTESGNLIEAAKADVEALISNTLDLDVLHAESALIETWLAANPSPVPKTK